MPRLAIAIVGVVTLTACSTAPAVKVETDRELRNYRTYRVLPAPARGALEDVATGAVVDRSVDETLGGKGYRQEATRPDFLVKWHMRIEGRARMPGTLDSQAFRDVRPMPSASTRSAPMPSQDREGTLTLDVIDAGSNMVVWRGSAQAALSGSGDSENREASIQDAVRRILERFPPQ